MLGRIHNNLPTIGGERSKSSIIMTKTKPLKIVLSLFVLHLVKLSYLSIKDKSFNNTMLSLSKYKVERFYKRSFSIYYFSLSVWPSILKTVWIMAPAILAATNLIGIAITNSSFFFITLNPRCIAFTILLFLISLLPLT